MNMATEATITSRKTVFRFTIHRSDDALYLTPRPGGVGTPRLISPFMHRIYSGWAERAWIVSAYHN